MIDQSQFSKYPKSHLVLISDKLIDSGFDAAHPYIDHSDNIDYITEATRVFGSSNVEDIDLQFFAKFIQINDDVLLEIFETKNRSLYDKLVIPIAKKYTIEYQTYGVCSYTEDYEDNTISYDKKWVRESIMTQYRDGEWNEYDGRLVNTEYENCEQSGLHFDSFIINDLNSIEDSIEESLLDKLVLENTNSVINSIDKKTLLKMKSIIENKLRSF